MSKGKLIARGTFFGGSRVYENSDSWVIKETASPSQPDYEFFKSRLGNFIPETQFQGQIIRQKRIHGRRICDINLTELTSNPKIISQLTDLFSRCVQMWEEDGRIPDLLSPDQGPLKTTNIMIENDSDRVYLVDTTANVKYFSKKSFILYRLRQEFTIKALKKFVRKFDSTSNFSQNNPRLS